MAAIIIGIVAVAIKVRLLFLFKKVQASAQRDKLIMQIAVLIMCAVMLPFLAVYLFSKS